MGQSSSPRKQSGLDSLQVRKKGEKGKGEDSQYTSPAFQHLCYYDFPVFCAVMLQVKEQEGWGLSLCYVV